MYIISVFNFRWFLYLSMFYITYVLNKKFIFSFTYIHQQFITTTTVQKKAYLIP